MNCYLELWAEDTFCLKIAAAGHVSRERKPGHTDVSLLNDVSRGDLNKCLSRVLSTHQRNVSTQVWLGEPVSSLVSLTGVEVRVTCRSNPCRSNLYVWCDWIIHECMNGWFNAHPAWVAAWRHLANWASPLTCHPNCLHYFVDLLNFRSFSVNFIHFLSLQSLLSSCRDCFSWKEIAAQSFSTTEMSNSDHYKLL